MSDAIPHLVDLIAQLELRARQQQAVIDEKRKELKKLLVAYGVTNITAPSGHTALYVEVTTTRIDADKARKILRPDDLARCQTTTTSQRLTIK
jgi:hypothetical protein